jgi:hypothetical protein
MIKAVSSGNIIMPAGNIRIGDLQPMVPINSVASNIQDLRDLPIRVGSGPAVSCMILAISRIRATSWPDTPLSMAAAPSGKSSSWAGQMP